MRIVSTLISLFVMFSLASVVYGQDDRMAMRKKEESDIREAAYRDPSVCAPDGVALSGYDVISYRDNGGPKPGQKEFAVEHGEFTYLFVNGRNKNRFEKNPKRYLPKYSAWCAISLALGRLTCPDYTNFQIENGQLLLFETTGFTNGRVLWNTDAPGFRVKADDNYGTLKEIE